MNDTEEIAQSFLPMIQGDGFGDTTDSKRANYLSKRVCNFSVRESCKLAKVSEKSIRRWRDSDPVFCQLDTEGMSDLRKSFGNELIDMEYTRNFHLVLQKDFKVLYKDATGGTLTEDEKEYILKIRQHYTPQSLAMVKQLLGGGTVETPFDFTKTVFRLTMEKTELIQSQRS